MSATTSDPAPPKILVTVRATGASEITAEPQDAGTLSRWGALIAADGIRAHEGKARRLAGLAARAGLSPVLVAVVTDPLQPSVARERAFGLLAADLRV